MKQLLLIAFALISFPTFAQLPSVTLDPRQAYFDGGESLPAESRWMLKGQAPQQTERVRVEVREKGTLLDNADFSIETSPYGEGMNFEFLMNYPLKEGKTYDFHFVFGRKLQKGEDKEMLGKAIEACNIYLDQTFANNGKKIRFEYDPRTVYKDLNELVQRFAHPFSEKGPEFSDAILAQLKTLDGTKLQDAKYNMPRDEGQSWRDNRLDYAEQKLDLLKKAIKMELGEIFRPELLVMHGEREVNEYPVEKAPFVLPVNLGYGVVFGPSAPNSINYATAPYAGISFPLGPRRFGERVSLSLGVFLTDLEFENGDQATGPFIKRPIYLALGLKALRVVRFNAGVAATQMPGGSGLSQIDIRPMAGLAIELNLWAGFGKRK